MTQWIMLTPDEENHDEPWTADGPFDTMEEAIDYSERWGIAYIFIVPLEPKKDENT